jgi:hypothetical protein
VFSVGSVQRLYLGNRNTSQSVRVKSRAESPETAVRRVEGQCEMAASLGGSQLTVAVRSW